MAEYALRITNVTGKKRKFHLSDVNMACEPGFIYAITGENGAGKTTLMQYILKENARYNGEILLYGENIRKHHAQAMSMIGFVSEDNVFFEDRTGKQNAELLGLLYDDFDRELFCSSMEEMQAPLGTTYRKMSRGEKMKFQLSFAIAHHSKLFLLDEATAGMDPVFRREFFDMLRKLLTEEDRCVLMTSHNMTEIQKQTDYVAIMEQGKLSPFRESMEEN
ncbi:MAG: ATP-binding cassette domain-containing protein [Lachnospiraceae bacterium]